MADLSSPERAASTSATAASILAFTSSPTFSPCSSKACLVWKTICSARFLTSTNSRRSLSADALASASVFMRSISSSDNPPELSIRMSALFPVVFSVAVTCKMPLASMLNSTSICGVPIGAGGIPPKSNRPSERLSAANSRSPCKIWIVTEGWLSAAVVNVSLREVGMVVFRSISLVVMPPLVSTPNESGVTSSKSTSFTSPPKTPPWMAAPMATTSSGLMDLSSSALPNTSLATSWTWGIRVEPPTMTTSSTLEPSSLASAKA